MGVAFLLSRRYLEAVKVFQLLAKEFPHSTSIFSNLLYAYLCDGWVLKVREARHAKIVRSIKSPLTEQARCIIGLIKLSFTDFDLNDGQAQPEQAYLSEQVQPTSEYNVLGNDLVAEEADILQDVNQTTPRLAGPSDGLLAKHNLISKEDLFTPNSGLHRSISPRREYGRTLISNASAPKLSNDQEVDISQFAYNRKLKDFKKDSVVPIHALLRMQVRAKYR